MRKNTRRKTVWTVEPVGRSEPEELAAALLASIEDATRYIDRLKSELQRLRSAPDRAIR